ncbi:MAG: bile acid:sodium symporter [Alistipes sp.]|nr:bile acid:sodium symporter [Alistipes sp.]
MRTAAMPLGMAAGALCCYPITAFDEWSGGLSTPFFIFSMLFCTFCRVNIRDMRPQWLHLWLMVAQIVGSIAIYLLLRPLGDTVAQGGMICALAPMAMGAVVIAGMLGANVTTMATHSLVCNIITAFVAPPIISMAGNGTCTITEILMRVAPLLVTPFIFSQLCRWLTPKVAGWFGNHAMISFYIWLLSLVVIVGKTTCFIIESGTEHLYTEILLAVVALVICLAQFRLGHWLGERYGDKAAGGQALGQKNTVLAIWLAQAFLNPLACVAPTAYIIWQNIVNSYQIYKKR